MRQNTVSTKDTTMTWNSPMKVSLSLVLTVSAFCGSVSALGASDSGCKAYPGDDCWPTAQTWKALNDTLGGNLLQPPPPGGVCHPGQINYQEGQCPTVAKEWSTFDFHVNDPVSVMSDQFTNYTCLPDENDPCSSAGYPAYVVNASTPAHVKIGIDFARRHSVRLNVKSSGHDFLGRSNAPGTLSLWVHHLNSIEHHAEDFTLGGSGTVLKGSAITVGGGTTLDEIYKATDKFNETAIGGFARTVSVGGYVTGGGHSALSPRYGLAADNILEMEVVTASGEILTVNQDQHQDLFWALRGGGGSTFGVITSMTMKTFPSPKTTQVGVIVLAKPGDPILPDVIGYIASQIPYLMDSGVSGYSYVGPSLQNPLPPGTGLPPQIAGMLGKFVVQDQGAVEAQKIFKPLNDTIIQRWKGEAKLFLLAQEFPSFYSWVSANYDEDPTGHSVWLASRLLGSNFLSADEKTIGNALWNASGDLGRLSLFLLGGKGVQNAQPAGGSDAVNPAWRKAYVHSYGAQIFEPFNQTASDNAVKTLNNAFQPIRDLSPGSGSYLNEALPFEPDWQHAFWGSNYERLVQIKRAVDPTDVFWCAPCVDNGRWKQHGDGRLCLTA